MAEIITRSEKETLECAKTFAQTLKPGTVLALKGELGSGKTSFVKGIAVGLGLEDSHEVTSPTFALMNVYQTKTPLYHFDLYRLDEPKEILNIGFEEFIHDSRAVSCVEWPEKASQDYFPSTTKVITFEAIDPNSRKICLPD